MTMNSYLTYINGLSTDQIRARKAAALAALHLTEEQLRDRVADPKFDHNAAEVAAWDDVRTFNMFLEQRGELE